jgi:allantoicase
VTVEFTELPDLASRDLAGSVVLASDELFAAKENLILPGPARRVDEFGHKGKVYDGWETRRRRDLTDPGARDYAVVRLGVPGVVRGVVVDTSWFTGNFPPECSVEAAAVDGYPSPAELVEVAWATLVPRSPLSADAANVFAVSDDARYTHVRLLIYPDGGVARLRVHGEPRPDPRLLTGTVDLAALENGGDLVECSDAFYSSARHLLMPGRPRSMADGWENARRRQHGGETGNDYVVVRLGRPGTVRRVEVDTSYFIGNAPGEAALHGLADSDGGPSWVELVTRTRLQPDTRHWFFVDDVPAVSQVRLDVYPDGGVARLRVWGEAASTSEGSSAG